MDKRLPSEMEGMSVRKIILILIGGALLVLVLALLYFLGLAWLLSVLSSLAFAQATAVSILMAGSTLLVISRIPDFDLPLLFIGLGVSAVLAVVEVFLARLVAWLTPLPMWEASLLTAATTALALFLFYQVILNATETNEEIDDSDNDEFEPTLHRLSPDMYVLKPRIVDVPAPKPRRAPRKRAKKESDETNTD